MKNWVYSRNYAIKFLTIILLSVIIPIIMMPLFRSVSGNDALYIAILTAFVTSVLIGFLIEILYAFSFNDDKDAELISPKKIFCPYCNSELTDYILKETKEYSFYIHPPDKYDVDSWTRKFFYRNGCPSKIDEFRLICKNCSWEYAINLFKYPQNDKRTKNYTNCNNLLKILDNRDNSNTSNRNTLMADIIEKYFQVYYKLIDNKKESDFIKAVLETVGIVLIYTPISLLIIVPIALLYSIGPMPIEIIYKYSLFLIIGFLIICLFRRHMRILSSVYDNDYSLIDFHCEYKKTGSYRLYEHINLKPKIFEQYALPITLPSIIGLAVAALYLIGVVYNLSNNSSTINSVTQFGTYVSFVVYLNLVCIPLFITILVFMSGNIFWYSLKTITFISFISKNMPLKIDLLHKTGGTEILGKLIFSSSYLFMLCIIVFALLFGLDISSLNTKVAVDFINSHIISQPANKLLVEIILWGSYIVMILYMFIKPLFNIHKQLTERKMDRISTLKRELEIEKLNSIDSGTFNRYIRQDDTSQILLLNKISSMSEWPFDNNIFSIVLTITKVFLLPIVLAIIKYYLSGSFF